MKTVLLFPELFVREGGIQRILRLYLKALGEMSKPGDEFDLVVLNDLQLPADRLARCANGRLARAHACAGRKLGFVRRTLQCAAGADRLICGHIGQLPVAWLARRLRRRGDYYLVAHGIEVWRPYSRIERWALRGARRILCVSAYTRDEMLRRTGLPASRFAVVPNTFDPDFVDRTQVDLPRAGPRVILAVARLDTGDAGKGVDHLIEALPAVRRALPGTRLRIVGTGDDLPRLRSLTDRLAVADAVEFAGLVGLPALRAAYRDCTLFALPSRKEGFGLVYLEAMAHGKPCLGARAGGVPEVIDERSGVLVDYGDAGQLADRLVWALQQPWDPVQIRSRAAQFSFPVFKQRLQAALNPAP